MNTPHNLLGTFLATLRDTGHSAEAVKAALQSFAGMPIAEHGQRRDGACDKDRRRG